MRGLKPSLNFVLPDNVLVAPLVGAWIETNGLFEQVNTPSVAPLVGAWIETKNCHQDQRITGVAPLVGAWIET